MKVLLIFKVFIFGRFWRFWAFLGIIPLQYINFLTFYYLSTKFSLLCPRINKKPWLQTYMKPSLKVLLILSSLCLANFCRFLPFLGIFPPQDIGFLFLNYLSTKFNLMCLKIGNFDHHLNYISSIYIKLYIYIYDGWKRALRTLNDQLLRASPGCQSYTLIFTCYHHQLTSYTSIFFFFNFFQMLTCRHVQCTCDSTPMGGQFFKHDSSLKSVCTHKLLLLF